MKTKKLLVIATMAFMLTVALFAGLSASAQAADAPTAANTWYCDPGNVNKGIQFTLDNLAAPGDTICLWPENYAGGNVFFYENVVVNYSVTILGLQNGRTAWEPRGSESYVYPALDDSLAVFQVKADHVTIDGVFVGAAGRVGTNTITAEHGILADASDIETDTIDNLTFANNFVESAVTGIELNGLYSDAPAAPLFYSLDNYITGNFILSYWNAPQEAKDGIEMTGNFFADVENNKVKNIDECFWIENYDFAAELEFESNIVENTNVPLCHAFYVHQIFGDVISVTIEDTTVTTYYTDVIAPAAVVEHFYAGTAIGIYDVDAGVQVTIDGLTATNCFLGIDLDDVGTYIPGVEITIDTPVKIMDVTVTNGAKGLMVFNDDYYYSEVDLSDAHFVNIMYDAIEVNSELLPPAPAITWGWMVVNLVDDVTVDGAADAVEVFGPQSVVYCSEEDYSVAFANVDEFYFNLIMNAFDIDATHVAFMYDGELKLASEMNWTELFDVEYKMHHAIDDVQLGFVMVMEDTAFVSDNKIIQNAIEVWGDDGMYDHHVFFAETVYVMWGNLYLDPSVYIYHSVDLIGVTCEWGPHEGWIPWLFYDETADVGYTIKIDDASNVLVQNIAMTGPECDNYEYPADAIIVEAEDGPVSDIALVDVQIDNYYGMGIVFIGDGYSFTNVEIEGCYVWDMDSRAVYLMATAFGDEGEDVLLNHNIEIEGCTFVDCLEDNDVEETVPAALEPGYYATVELWGITDTTIEDNFFFETWEGDFNPYMWYLALLGTAGTNDVTGNWFNGYQYYWPGYGWEYVYEAQNGVYVETDAGGNFMAAGQHFVAAPPVFSENLFNLRSLLEVDSAPSAVVADGPMAESYALYYYEGDDSNYDEEDFVAPAILNAKYNYWNDPMGPYSDPDHVFNPNADGLGPQVEDFVDFGPWYMYHDGWYLYGLTADIFISADHNIGRQFVDGDQTFCTIQAGIDAAVEGDWVIVNPGLYYETVDISSDIFLLGGYTLRGGYTEPVMFGDGVSTWHEYTYIMLVNGCSATVDYFMFQGSVERMVVFYEAEGVISTSDFAGSSVEDQVAVDIRAMSDVECFANVFTNIAMDTGQDDEGAICVYSESSADIHDNWFGGYASAIGIWALDVTEDLDIEDNEFYGFMYGIFVDMYDEDSAPSTGIEISGNWIEDCLAGVALKNVENSIIEENTIIGAEELPYNWWYNYLFSYDVMVWECGENVVVVNNNLLSAGNTDDTVGVWNDYFSDYYVIALDNYWGKQSGPAGGCYYYDNYPVFWTPFGYSYAQYYAMGGGSMVSTQVYYGTWLNMAYPNGESIYANYDYLINMYGGSEYYSDVTDIEISVPEGPSQYAQVVLGKYVGSPGETFWGYNLGIYVEIAICHEHMGINALNVEIYFGDANLEGINVDELRLFYWVPSEDGLTGTWMPCIGSVVDVENKYVEMTFYADGPGYPSLDMLANDMAFLIGAPKLTIDPQEGKSGITITANGSGFIAGDIVMAYIGDTLLGAVPTQLKGVYMVDEDGNISDIQLILPYLNKGEYTIKVSDVEYAYHMSRPVAPGVPEPDDISEYVASATYTVLGNMPLALSLDVGSIYFAGEVANWVFSVTEEGSVYETSLDMITAYLVYAPTGEEIPVPAEAIMQVDENTFVVTMTLDGSAPAGEYYLKVYVADDMYQGAEGKAFQVSGTFGNMVFDLADISDGIMTIESQLDTMQLSIDEIDARVIAIQGNTVSIMTTLGQVKTTVDRIDVNVIAVQNSIATMQVTLGTQIANGFATVQSSLADLDAKVVSIQDDIVVLQTSVGTVQTTLNEVAANVISIQSGVVTLQTSVGNVQTTLNAIGAQVSTINGNVVVLMTKVGEIQTNLTAIQASIAALDGKVVTLTTNVGTVQTSVDAIKVVVDRIDGRTVYMNTTLGTMSGTLVSVNNNLGTINTELGTVQTDVGNIASATTGINSTLAFAILAILIVVAIVLIFLRTGKKA